LIVKLLYGVLFGVPLTLTREILVKLRDEIDKERLITEESIKERLLRGTLERFNESVL